MALNFTHFLCPPPRRRWDDNSATLTWSRAGTFSDSHVFTQIEITAWFEGGKQVAAAQELTKEGKVIFTSK